MPDQDPDNELTHLRHVAYSRQGSVADRARLAEIERAQTTPPTEPATATSGAMTDAASDGDDSPDRDEHADSDPADSDLAHSDLAPTPRGRRGILVATVVGALVGALGVVVADRIFSGPEFAVFRTVTEAPWPDAERGSTLEVFDREPTAADAAAAEYLSTLLFDIEDLEARQIGAAEDGAWTAIGVRGVQDGGQVVCLMLRSEPGVSAGCAPLPIFLRDGMITDLNGFAVRWGPAGDDLWVADGFDGY